MTMMLEGRTISVDDPDRIRGQAHKAVDFVFNNWYQVCLGTAGLVGFIAQFVTDGPPPQWVKEAPLNEFLPFIWPMIDPAMIVAYLGFGIAGGVGAIRKMPIHSRQVKRIEDLERELGEQTALFSGMLNSLLEGLLHEIGLYDTATRISGYIRSESSYVLLARVSKNSIYEKPGRPIYPVGQGVLDAIWNKGTCCEAFPARDDYYKTRMVNAYGYEERTVDRFTMKARSMGGVRAYDEAKRQTVAAIVIENEDGSVLDMEMMTRIENAGVWKTLQTYLVTSTELFPDIHDARVRGF